MRSLFTTFWLIASLYTQAQILPFLPDSVKKQLAIAPKNTHDTIYASAGEAFYAQYNEEGYSRALDCYKEALRLAEKYKNDTFAISINYGIGGVYDAIGNEPKQVLYYYKKAFDFWENTGEPTSAHLSYTYGVAHAYNLLRDSANSMFYVNLIDKHKAAIKNKKRYNELSLSVAYMTLKNNNIKDFLTRFEALDKTFVYQDTYFSFGAFFALCAWRFAYEKGDYSNAIEAMLFALKHNTNDSTLLMPYLSTAYAKTGNYEKAFQWSEALNGFNTARQEEAVKKDVRVKLFETSKELAEKDKALKEAQNRYLLRGLLLTLFLMGVAAYFWFINFKGKKEKEALNIVLAERNAEKTVLINEIHHRVKNNLQLLYSLAKLQLPTIKDEAAKALWQKHLGQLKAMSLVNEKLYNTEGLSSVSLNAFTTDILQHFTHIFPVKHPLSKNVTIAENISVDADFAISYGLILSELVTNSYKYAFPNTEQPQLTIEILATDTTTLLFNYTDFGQVETPSVFSTKQVGGVALIHDLTRQLKGKVRINHVPYLSYQFSFELKTLQS